MKKTMKNILRGTMLIVIVIVVTLLARFAYSKYISIVNGRAEAQIAQFNFIVTGQSYSEESGIIFATTRNDRNSKVTTNMLAPGTYGEIPINIDATGTQTFLEYTINISLENKPENLKLYYDKERTLEISVNQIDHYNSEFSRKGFLSFADNDLSRTEYIYWEWPLETGETEEDINKNDIKDSKWMNNIMKMSISVKGTQVAEKPMYYLAEYGDIVNYTIGETIIKGIVVNKKADIVEIMPIDEISQKAITVGVVKLKDINGADGYDGGYNQAINLINNEAIKEYKIAKVDRALRVEDVNRITGFNPTTDYPGIVYSQKHTNGFFVVDERTIVNDTIYATSLTGVKKGSIIKIGDTIGGNTINSVTVVCNEGENTNAYYQYNKAKINPSRYLNTTCWLASCAYNLRGGPITSFLVRTYEADTYMIYSRRMNSSRNEVLFDSLPVVPVISILSNIESSKNLDGTEWIVNQK